MERSCLAFIAGMLLVAAVPVSAVEVGPQEVAAKAASQLGQEMRRKLIDSMQKNGPAGSIVVCAKDAPLISSRIEQELGVSIKRTSLKVRNPRNAPDTAEREVLESLDLSQKAGRTLPPGVTVFPGHPRRFYKTITVEQACLKCHGDATTVNEQVRREIAAKYPDDKAVGYKEGDLRGIISVTVK